MNNELLLFDRIEAIKSVINQYGESNFYLSFSGGKDSTVLHHLLDMALPNNKIPRVFCDTGIEYDMVRKFVLDLQKTDNRIEIIKPTVPIRQMLERDGYPFKSKEHSQILSKYQTSGLSTNWVKNYLGIGNLDKLRTCPNTLRYQFKPDFKMKISDKCCKRLKVEPLKLYSERSGRKCAIIAIRRSEGGRRNRARCKILEHDKLIKFQPLVVVDDDWIHWFIDENDIQLVELYYHPYDFDRTGCKGCPFAPRLQTELDTLEKLLPAEKNQCELIWSPVYSEYRRIAFRLRRNLKRDVLHDY